jgi:hypothetical protein
MKKFSKEDLQEQAEKFMEAEGVDSFLATEDGNFFNPKDKSLALDHNAKNVKGEVVFEFTKPVEVVEPTKEEKVKAIKDAIAEMAGINITDHKEIAGRLKKAKFNKELVAEVLAEMEAEEAAAKEAAGK